MSPPPLPKHWPLGLPYLTNPVISKTLTPSDLLALRTRPSPSALSQNPAKGPSPLIKITPITTPSHPAFPQNGLFATKNLPPGTFILLYLGVIHKTSSSPDAKEDIHSKSDYDLSLDRFLQISIDAATSGNEARFINDYRGVADKPNAEFREVWNQGSGERGMGVWVLPAGKGREKGVRKGEEILVSYGRGFWGARKEVEGG